MPLDLSSRDSTEEQGCRDHIAFGEIDQQRYLETQMNAHLWGYLKPMNPDYAQIDFWRLKTDYTIGRLDGGEEVDISILGTKISSLHCTLSWDSKEGLYSQVIVFDHSSNGTYINGDKIGQDRCAILRDGDILALALPEHIFSASGRIDDYRFQFRHMVVRSARADIGTLFSKQERVGSGSFGTVWKGYDHTHNRVVAIKTIDLLKKSNAKRSFVLRNIAQEIVIMDKLAHPNICELHNFYFDLNASDIHLVLEFVDGGDLCRYMINNKITHHTAHHLTYELCCGLAYLHLNGIAHRDIKPDNLMITRDDPPRIKITDFGLSKHFSDKTALHSRVGTRNYMAPEIFDFERRANYTYVLDSWAVGVVVYAMVTYDYPWTETPRDSHELAFKLAFSSQKFMALPANCQSFIRRLLDIPASTRMSISAALHHSWLADWEPIYNNDAYERGSRLSGCEGWSDAMEDIEVAAMKAERKELGLRPMNEISLRKLLKAKTKANRDRDEDGDVEMDGDKGASPSKKPLSPKNAKKGKTSRKGEPQEMIVEEEVVEERVKRMRKATRTKGKSVTLAQAVTERMTTRSVSHKRPAQGKKRTRKATSAKSH